MKNRPFLWENISRYKNEIYGISILWIMLFHAIAMVGLDYTLGGMAVLKPFDAIIGYGNLGVEIFLLCSGICLYFSYYRKPEMLLFLKKRFMRLFLPVIVISGPYWVWKLLIKEQVYATFISKLTMLDFWISGDQQMWFVSLILVCYILYPYIYAFLFQNSYKNIWIRLVILLAIVMIPTLAMAGAYPETFAKIEIALSRIPVFIIGCFLGKFVYEKKTMPRWIYAAAVVVDCFVLGVLYLNLLQSLFNRWFYMIGGVSMTITIVGILNVLKCTKLQRFLTFFGKLSLNLYIAHIIVIRLYKETIFFEEPRLFHYAVIMIISIIIAWIAEKIITSILKR